MATLIPLIGTGSFETTGERRLAERLEQKQDDDYLLWCDVPMGPRNTHPDCCVMHPRRGILVLEEDGVPLEMRRSPSDFDPTINTIKVMPIKASKSLEFPVVALAGFGTCPQGRRRASSWEHD